jgi:hypothetical protein
MTGIWQSVHIMVDEKKKERKIKGQDPSIFFKCVPCNGPNSSTWALPFKSSMISLERLVTKLLTNGPLVDSQYSNHGLEVP